MTHVDSFKYRRSGYFAGKIFFRRQPYIGYRSMYVCAMDTRYFVCLIFVSKGPRQKTF